MTLLYHGLMAQTLYYMVYQLLNWKNSKRSKILWLGFWQVHQSMIISPQYWNNCTGCLYHQELSTRFSCLLSNVYMDWHLTICRPLCQSMSLLAWQVQLVIVTIETQLDKFENSRRSFIQLCYTNFMEQTSIFNSIIRFTV